MEFTDDDVYTEVLPFLFLSSSIGATNEHQLRKNGITVILNLTEKQITYPEGDFESVHICMADIRSQDATGPIEQANEIIDNARKNLGRVLVHCTRGQSRSPIIAIAYLMKSRGWPLLKSFLFVRQKRPWIGPNPSFMSQMMLYEDHLQLAHSSPFPLHAYTLLESRDEDFDENISALGLTPDCPQDLFELMEPQNLKKAVHFIKDNTNFRYTRRNTDADETPLHFGVTLASEEDNLDRDLLLELLEELTDSTTINQDTLLGETPLIAAARQEDVCLVRFLLQHDADPGHINASGKNALHYASNCLGSEHSATAVEIVQELLKASRGHATVITDDIHGFNPIDYAKFSPELTTQLHSRFIEELLPTPKPEDQPLDWFHSQMALFVFHTIRTETWKCVFNLFFGPKMQLGDEEMVLANRVFESQCSLVFGEDSLEGTRNTSLSRRTRQKLLVGGKSKVCLYGSAAEISPRFDEVIIEHQVIHFIIDSVKEKLPSRHALHLLIISLFENRELALDCKPSLEISVSEALNSSADAISALLHSNFSVLSSEDGRAILNNALETIRASLKSLRHYHRKPSTSRLLF